MKSCPIIQSVFVLLLAFLPNTFAQNDIVSQWFALQKDPPKDTLEVRRKTFEEAWQTVNINHFEADFNGIDWNKVKKRYSPLVDKTKNNEELINLLNKMLGELKRSHNVILSTKEILQGDSKATADTGIILKFIDGYAVMTKVEADSTAAGNGIKQGFIVTEINGKSVKDIAKEAFESEFVPYLKLDNVNKQLKKALRGEVNSQVKLKYLDERNKLKTVILKRIPLKGKLSKNFGVFPTFIQIEAKKFEGNIGYLKFNTFLDPENRIVAALETLLDSSAIILDLRDNGGGDTDVENAIISRFIDKPTIFNKIRTRNGDSLHQKALFFLRKITLRED